MTRPLLLITTALLLPLTADAQGYCSKPDAPSCASRYGTFDDQDEFERCRSRMTAYRSDVESYLSCIKRESDSALQDYNDAVERFNQRARG
jgi:hypothetical protein